MTAPRALLRQGASFHRELFSWQQLRAAATSLQNSACARTCTTFRFQSTLTIQPDLHSNTSNTHFSDSNNNNNSSNDKKPMQDYKQCILEHSLQHVYEHGWTEDALAAGVASANLPPSMIGLVKGKQADLVTFYMETCTKSLQTALEQKSIEWEKEGYTVAQRIENSIQVRLQMNIPYIQQKRWHEAMAIGATPPTTITTAEQLEQMIRIIVATGCGLHNAGPVERSVIGAVYIATELHMLSDKSLDFADTWTFLHQRVSELEAVVTNGPTAMLLSGDAVVAASALATSFGGALLSLAQPSTRSTFMTAASSFFPQFGGGSSSNNSNSQNSASYNNTANTLFHGSVATGSHPTINLDDLPPFETQNSSTGVETNSNVGNGK